MAHRPGRGERGSAWATPLRNTGTSFVFHGREDTTVPDRSTDALLCVTGCRACPSSSPSPTGPWPPGTPQRTCHVKGPGLCAQLHATQAGSQTSAQPPSPALSLLWASVNVSPSLGRPGCWGVCPIQVSRSLPRARDEGSCSCDLLWEILAHLKQRTRAAHSNSHSESVRGPAVRRTRTLPHPQVQLQSCPPVHRPPGLRPQRDSGHRRPVSTAWA